MTHSLDQEQAANILGLTPRRLRQMDREADPPPRLANGRYPSSAFCHWMLQRSFTQRSSLAGRAFKAGLESGTGAAFWRTAHELAELARPDGQAADEEALAARLDPERRAELAELRARFWALPNAADAAALIREYADRLTDHGW